MDKEDIVMVNDGASREERAELTAESKDDSLEASGASNHLSDVEIQSNLESLESHRDESLDDTDKEESSFKEVETCSVDVSECVTKNDEPMIEPSYSTMTDVEDTGRKPSEIIEPKSEHDYTDMEPSQEDIAAKINAATSSLQQLVGSGIDRYGFSRYDDFRLSLRVKAQDISARKAKETERERKWLAMVKDPAWHSLISEKKRAMDRVLSPAYSQLRSRIRKGIPDAWRGQVWMDLLEPQISEMKAKYPFRSEVELSELTAEDIEKDIERTFPKHELFMHGGLGQDPLRRVLRAYAFADKECGYCQGMSFIAGMFVSYLAEENAYYVLLTSMLRLKPISSGPRCNLPLRSMFLPTLAEVQRVLYVFENLCKLHIPKLWRHLESESVMPSMFATEWFMTMFCRGFSFDLVTRVWDIYLLEGYKIVYRVSMALLKLSQTELLVSSFEDIMARLRDMNKFADAEAVINTAFSIPLKRSHIRRFQAKYDKATGA